MYVKGVYIDTIEVQVNGESINLNIWMNPETKRIFGIVNMEIDTTRNFANDPYDDDIKIVFEDTFSGLPK